MNLVIENPEETTKKKNPIRNNKQVQQGFGLQDQHTKIYCISKYQQ